MKVCIYIQHQKIKVSQGLYYVCSILISLFVQKENVVCLHSENLSVTDPLKGKINCNLMFSFFLFLQFNILMRRGGRRREETKIEIWNQIVLLGQLTELAGIAPRICFVNTAINIISTFLLQCYLISTIK